MGTGGGWHAARVWDQPAPCQRLPPLCRRPVDTPLAAASGSRADRRLSICGRCGARLSARRGWEEATCGTQGQVGAVRPVAPRGQDPARRVWAVRRTKPASRRAAAPGDLRLSGLHALLQRDQRRQVHGQTEDASEAHGSQVEGAPRGDGAPDAHPCQGATPVAVPGAARSLSVLWRHLQPSIFAHVQRLRPQAMAKDAWCTKPEGPRDLGGFQENPGHIPTPETGNPSALAQMIDPPQVHPEEPTAVTPHGGIRGGKSQQWLSYPTNPHVACDVEGAGDMEWSRTPRSPGAPVLDPTDERGRETASRPFAITAPVLDS